MQDRIDDEKQSVDKEKNQELRDALVAADARVVEKRMLLNKLLSAQDYELEVSFRPYPEYRKGDFHPTSTDSWCCARGWWPCTRGLSMTLSSSMPDW